MSDSEFDLVVIGGGPGGYVAAIRASQLGLKAAVVEREHLGGVCLNWGCIPTKALLRTAEIHHLLQHLDEHGFSAGEVTFDFSKVVKRSRKVAKRLAAGVKHLLKKNAVEVVTGHARMLGPGRVEVANGDEGQLLTAPHIVLATGTSLQNRGDSVAANLRLEDGSEAAKSFDRAILAIGITGNVEDLGLESTAIRSDRGHLVVNEWLETDEPGHYAIGDVAGPPWLAHKASHEAVLCVEKVAGVAGAHPLDVSRIPGCTYCRPQIASVGLTEAAALAAGHEVRIGRFPFLANGKAVALGEVEGLVKTVFDAATGELLGAHLFGSEVTELIQGFVIARGLEATETELMQAIFPHPTLSEAMHESVLDAYDRALHI